MHNSIRTITTILKLCFQFEVMESEKREIERQFNDCEMQRKQLRMEKETLADSRDAAKAMADNIEKDKKYVEALLNEARNANSNLEAHVSDVEQTMLALQGIVGDCRGCSFI